MMDIVKLALSAIGGLLLGLYFAGHNIFAQLGLPLDKQAYVGGIAILGSIVIHIAGGGRLWPSND